MRDTGLLLVLFLSYQWDVRRLCDKHFPSKFNKQTVQLHLTTHWLKQADLFLTVSHTPLSLSPDSYGLSFLSSVVLPSEPRISYKLSHIPSPSLGFKLGLTPPLSFFCLLFPEKKLNADNLKFSSKLLVFAEKQM